MKKICIAASFFFSLTTSATNFSGHWSGSGQATTASSFIGNKTYPCSKVELIIEHRTQQLTVQKYQATCEFIGGSDWGPYHFEIRGEKVFEHGEETGSFIGDTFKTLQNDGGVQYAFNLRLQEPQRGENPLLETYYGTRNLSGTIVIEGKLAPQNSSFSK